MIEETLQVESIYDMMGLLITVIVKIYRAI